MIQIKCTACGGRRVTLFSSSLKPKACDKTCNNVGTIILIRTEFSDLIFFIKGITEDVLKAYISMGTAYKQVHEKSQNHCI